jgi:hypothetical protein
VEDWRRLRNGELHDMYTSPNIIGVIKSRTMCWVGHAESMGEMRNTEKLVAKWRIILEWISGK